MKNPETWIQRALVGLVVLDLVLALWGYLWPSGWFYVFHGAEYVDPQAYLPRAAGNWTAFLVLQAIALALWKKQPVWLAVIAGVHLSDVFTDWSCLYFCESATWAGKVLLTGAGVGNVFFGLFFLWAFFQQTRPSTGTSPAG